MKIRPEQFKTLAADLEGRLLAGTVEQLQGRFPVTTNSVEAAKLLAFAEREFKAAGLLGIETNEARQVFVLLRWLADFEPVSKVVRGTVNRVLKDTEASANERIRFLDRHVLNRDRR